MSLKAIAAQSGKNLQQVTQVFDAARYAGFANPMSVTASKFLSSDDVVASNAGGTGYETMLNDVIGAHRALELQNRPAGKLFSTHHYVVDDPILEELLNAINLPESHFRVFRNTLLSSRRKVVNEQTGYMAKSAYDEIILIFQRFFDRYEIPLEFLSIGAALQLVRQSVTISDLIDFLDSLRGVDSTFSQAGKNKNVRLLNWTANRIYMQDTGENHLWEIGCIVECVTPNQSGLSGAGYGYDVPTPTLGVDLLRNGAGETKFAVTINQIYNQPFNATNGAALKRFQFDLVTRVPLCSPENFGKNIEAQLNTKVKPVIKNLFGAV